MGRVANRLMLRREPRPQSEFDAVRNSKPFATGSVRLEWGLNQLTNCLHQRNSHKSFSNIDFRDTLRMCPLNRRSQNEGQLTRLKQKKNKKKEKVHWFLSQNEGQLTRLKQACCKGGDGRSHVTE